MLETERLVGSLLALILILLLFSILSRYDFAAGITERDDLKTRLGFGDLDLKSLDMIWNERVIDTLVQSILVFASVSAVSLVFKGWLKE